MKKEEKRQEGPTNILRSKTMALLRMKMRVLVSKMTEEVKRRKEAEKLGPMEQTKKRK